MKESIDLFPDSERKTEWLTWIEDGRKENLRRFKELSRLSAVGVHIRQNWFVLLKTQLDELVTRRI
jgi:hypothetical protein